MLLQLMNQEEEEHVNINNNMEDNQATGCDYDSYDNPTSDI